MTNKLLILGMVASTFLMSHMTNAACTTDPTATSNKCELVYCDEDWECLNRNCDGDVNIPFEWRAKGYDGVCLSYYGRPPVCDTNTTATFYRCGGMDCRRDSDCYTLECDYGKCRFPGLATIYIVLIVIGSLILVAAIAILVCLHQKRKRQFNENLTGGAYPDQKKPFVNNY